MDDEMPPLTSTLEALPFRVERLSKPTAAQPVDLEEGEVDERQQVGCSSSPPPLIEDHSGLLDESDGALPQAETRSLYNDLELSLYEYAALEERYRTLSGQHRELRKLTQAFDEIIRGSSGYDEDAASIEQLRADAGRDGLRARALEADILKPMIREAGGVQALVSRMQSIEPLIEEAGGTHELKELVADAHTLRFSIAEQKLVELRASINGPDGFRAKALKYDMLQQCFAAIQRGPDIEQAQPSCPSAPTGTTQTQVDRFTSDIGAIQAPQATVLVSNSTLTPNGAATMNPARAAMLSAVPRDGDPNRDLYEASPPPKRKTSTKTGSNDVPLGRRRGGSSSNDHGHVGGAQKRKFEDELRPSILKRPRVDLDRASELVQSTLQGRPKTATVPNHGRLEPANKRYSGSLQNTPTAYLANSSTAASDGAYSQWEGRLRERSERMPSRDPVYLQGTPVVKREVRERD